MTIYKRNTISGTFTDPTLIDPILSGTLTSGGNILIGSVADKLNAAHLAIASQAIGDLIYADSATSFARRAAVASGQVLSSNGVGAAPVYTASPSLTALTLTMAASQAANTTSLTNTINDTQANSVLGAQYNIGTSGKAQGILIKGTGSSPVTTSELDKHLTLWGNTAANANKVLSIGNGTTYAETLHMTATGIIKGPSTNGVRLWSNANTGTNAGRVHTDDVSGSVMAYATSAFTATSGMANILSGGSIAITSTSTMALTPTTGFSGLVGTGTWAFARNAQTSGTAKGFTYTGAAHTGLTASTEVIETHFDLAQTVQHATGALTTQRAMVVSAPTYSFAGASTLTTGATLAISGPPVAGTNATLTHGYALLCQDGAIGLVNATVAPTSQADTVKIYARDISAGNSTLALFTETAPAADAALASTHSLTVYLNGSTYKIMLVSV